MKKERGILPMLDFLSSIVATASDPVALDWGNIINANSFDGMMNGINSALPIVVPVGLTILGLGVVWKLIKKFAK